MTRRKALGVGAAVMLSIAAALPAPKARADGYTRVTSYFQCCTTATGTTVTAGRTAACSVTHLGQTVHLVNAGLTLTCEDTGAAWWFEADTDRVDVYGIWLGEDYDYVWFE